jgi:hypothetical protein
VVTRGLSVFLLFLIQEKAQIAPPDVAMAAVGAANLVCKAIMALAQYDYDIVQA